MTLGDAGLEREVLALFSAQTVSLIEFMRNRNNATPAKARQR